MIPWIGGVTVILEALAVVCILFSIAFPERRIWPPPAGRSWQAVLMNVIFWLSAAGIFLLGILEWRGPTYGFLTGVRMALGGIIWAGGFGLTVWAIFSLGVAGTLGGGVELSRRGPYRMTRNPQYLAFIIMLIGWNLLIASEWVLATAGMAGVAIWFAPWAEEPWLRQNLGEDYMDYRRMVPRWLWH